MQVRRRKISSRRYAEAVLAQDREEVYRAACIEPPAMLSLLSKAANIVVALLTFVPLVVAVIWGIMDSVRHRLTGGRGKHDQGET